MLSEGFHLLKWLGVAYLLCLGIRHLHRTVVGKALPSASLSGTATFSHGFLVSLTNPKTLLFFSAFFPQFISSTESYLQQITLLSETFLLLAMLLDSCYAILAAKLQALFGNHRLQRIQDGLSGTLFIGAGAWLATVRRI